MKEVNRKSKYLLIGGGLLLLLILIVGGLWLNYSSSEVEAGLKLAVAKDQIIDFQVLNLGDSQDEKIVKYHYLSNEEIRPMVYRGLKEDISKRTNNSVTFLKSVKPINDRLQREEYVSKFFPSPTWQKSGGKWYRVDVATTTKTAFFNQTKLTAIDNVREFFGQKVLADTFYSGVGDGYVSKGSSPVWSTTHDATTGSSVNYTATSTLIESITNPFNSNYIIARGFLPFDTSAIPSDASITSASLYFYPVAVLAGDGFFNIVQTSQASSASLTTADYDTAGAVTNPEVGATAIYLSSMTIDTYNYFALNSTGLGWIKKSGETSTCGTTAGYTCLGIRDGSEMANSDTGGGILAISSSEETGTSQDPYLEVAYVTVAPSKAIIDGGTIQIDGGTLKID